ncbi:MAG: hypothetical protein IPJ25_08510 [Rhodocyclaceae bacterium]|nr:hypothetical protein [Rhodocyclaceae bacterium]
MTLSKRVALVIGAVTRLAVQGFVSSTNRGQDEAAILRQAETVAGFNNADQVFYKLVLTEARRTPDLQNSVVAFIDRPLARCLAGGAQHPFY